MTERTEITNLIKLAQADPKLAEQLHNENKASEAIKAFGKFQQNLEPIPKRGKIPGKSKKTKRYYVRSRYAYFDDLKDKVNKAMKGTGLTWMQVPGKPHAIHVPILNRYGQPTGQLTMGMKIDETTILMYKNGYKLPSGYMSTVAQSLSPQDIGSATTYVKRYSLAMAVGASSEPDNDGKQNGYSRPPYQQHQTPSINASQISNIQKLANTASKQRGAKPSAVISYVANRYSNNRSTLNKIPANRYNNVVSMLKQFTA